MITQKQLIENLKGKGKSALWLIKHRPTGVFFTQDDIIKACKRKTTQSIEKEKRLYNKLTNNKLYNSNNIKYKGDNI